jgi:hypothetical protein
MGHLVFSRSLVPLPRAHRQRRFAWVNRGRQPQRTYDPFGSRSEPEPQEDPTMPTRPHTSRLSFVLSMLAVESEHADAIALELAEVSPCKSRQR